jgi:geranylgeranyl diphosphate synthase, type II
MTIYLNHFEKYLKESKWPDGYENLYDPCAYIMKIGGKRIRPVSMLMAYHMFKPDYERIEQAAFAIEVFHNFTLMHDDIMDQADLRRNQPTVHTKYNLNTAILSGDVMLIHAFDILLKCCDKKSYGPVLGTFTEVARGVCEGQRLDMDFETQISVKLARYVQMITLKTAVLLAGSLKIGALLAGAKARDAKLLYSFGLDAGIAFQILDDYLDAFGEQASFGKTVGGDILQNKKTFLVLKAYETMPSIAKKRLKDIFSSKISLSPDEKVMEVKALFLEHGIDQKALEASRAYTVKAKQALDRVQVAPENKLPLLQMLDDLLQRNS